MLLPLTPSSDRQERVLSLLQELDSLEKLKELFWQELNYDRTYDPVTDSLTERQQEPLAEQPSGRRQGRMVPST